MAATTTKKNIFKKLADARLEFLKENVQKTGVNMSAEYDFFELKDIVPIGTEILAKHGLLYITTFPDGIPTGQLYDMDSDNMLVFMGNKVEGEIETSTGKKIMMNIQSEGAKQTYHRRYLWMLVLDVVEHDEIDSKDFTKDKVEEKPKKPVTEQERAEIKKELTDSNAQADELQIEQLKKALKMLNECEGDFEEFISEIVVKTENFTNLTKENCATLILKIGELIEESKRGVVS